MPSPEGGTPLALKDALSFLEAMRGQRAMVELGYGAWTLARFPLHVEDADLDEEFLTVIGDVSDMGDALVYSEVNLPLAQEGGYEISIAAGEMRLISEEGMRLSVTALGA